jgi:asparagine synthase (glutamine-hydrolysing)
VYRPKGLFSAPLRAWIRRDLREMVDDLLLSGELVRCGFLDQPSVRQVVDDDRANIADNSKQIWHLMTMELWLRNHAEARPRADTLRDTARVGHA